MKNYVIACEALTKTYHKHLVVNRVNMHVKEGEIYGLVGPNGAGKSTILKMILNLVRRDEGELLWMGAPVTKNDYMYLGKIGSLIENPYFYDDLSGMDNLLLHLSYLGLPNKKIAEEAMRMVSLPVDYSKKVSEYSLGMKQRLAIARALSSKPNLLIMDEPINGLDPKGIVDIRNLLLGLNRDLGTSIIITSHILPEVEQLADTVGFLQGGSLIQEIPMKEILEKNSAYVEIYVDNTSKAAGVLEDKLSIENLKVISEGRIRIYEDVTDTAAINQTLVLNGLRVESIRRKENNLEDYFFRLEKDEALS